MVNPAIRLWAQSEYTGHVYGALFGFSISSPQYSNELFVELTWTDWILTRYAISNIVIVK